jgi:hypothetical protein
LAAFGSVDARLLSGCKFGCRPGSAGKRTDRREYFSPMPKGDADVFEILIGQIAKYRDINPVLGKALRVSPSLSTQSTTFATRRFPLMALISAALVAS